MAEQEGITIDPYEFMKISLNPDGSLTRHEPWPTAAVNSSSNLALSKDVPLNPSTATSLRLFRPPHLPPSYKLPIIIYFHGGGFTLLSAASEVNHHACCNLAALMPSFVVSVEYRLAPEHRLPAAYEDAVDAILWIKSQAMEINGQDEWLRGFGDFSNIYLMGTSAGGNIAYHAGLRAIDLDLFPVQIQGLIMDQPGFGGVHRTESEKRLRDNLAIPLIAIDLQWSLALPLGADRDHEYCNPMAGSRCDEKVSRMPKSLIIGYQGDPLVDKQRELAAMLESWGVQVVGKFYDGGFHGANIFDQEYEEIFYDQVKSFINFDGNTG